MRYADSLLAPGETIILRERQHPFAILLDSRRALIAFGVAIVALVLAALLRSNQQVSNVLSIVGLIALAIGVILFAFNVWQWYAQDYLVTNRRLLKVDGVINKTAADSSLEKINDAVLRQGLWGRLFNYGDLEIMTAAEEGTIDDYHMLHRAPHFKKTMVSQKHELEMQLGGRAPSPPMMATSAVPTMTAASAPTTAMPVPGGGVSSDVDTPEEITEALARLADLRDRGVISPAEYEAKKAELLTRL